MASPTFCQVCGIEAPTGHVNFYQNIGMVFSRSHSNIQGELCRPCIKKYFKSYTLTTLFLGWWGLISLFVTPFALFGNIISYLGARNVPGPGFAALNTPLANTGVIKGADRSFKFKLIYG